MPVCHVLKLPICFNPIIQTFDCPIKLHPHILSLMLFIFYSTTPPWCCQSSTPPPLPGVVNLLPTTPTWCCQSSTPPPLPGVVNLLLHHLSLVLSIFYPTTPPWCCQSLPHHPSLVLPISYPTTPPLCYSLVGSSDGIDDSHMRGTRQYGDPSREMLLQHLPCQQEPHQPDHGQRHTHSDSEHHIPENGE